MECYKCPLLLIVALVVSCAEYSLPAYAEPNSISTSDLLLPSSQPVPTSVYTTPVPSAAPVADELHVSSAGVVSPAPAPTSTGTHTPAATPLQTNSVGQEPSEPLESGTVNPTTATETTEPMVETTEPIAGTTEPIAGTTEPTEETTGSTAETTEPTVETTEPIAGTTEPMAETTEPTKNAIKPTAETTEPTKETIVPTAETTVPVQTTVPMGGTTVPTESTTGSVEITKATGSETKPTKPTSGSTEQGPGITGEEGDDHGFEETVYDKNLPGSSSDGYMPSTTTIFVGFILILIASAIGYVVYHNRRKLRTQFFPNSRNYRYKRLPHGD